MSRIRFAIRVIFLVLLTLSPFQWAVATEFYVSPTGSDLTGNGTQSNPWKTIGSACLKVPGRHGHVIRLAPGTYTENGIDVPPGVSIRGSGRRVTIIKADSSFYHFPADPGFSVDKFLINFRSNVLSSGEQSIRDLMIDGDQKKLHGGIYVKSRTNILIQNVDVENTNFTGIWLWDTQDSRITDVRLKNCAWGSPDWASGALSLANLNRVELDHVNVDEGLGYGVKALGSTGPMYYLKVHDCHFSVAPVGQWLTASGEAAPNIAFELWNVDILGCEFYNNYVDNTLSLIMDTPQWIIPKGDQTIRIYNNIFDLDTRSKGTGYAIEISIHDVEIDHNYFLKGTHGIANWDTHGTKMSNWSIHHNVFYGIKAYYPGEIVRAQNTGFHNVRFYNNTVESVGKSTTNIFASYGGASENVAIINNLIINSSSGYDWYPNRLFYLEKATLTGLVVENNLIFNQPIGDVPGRYQNNLSSDPKIKRNGARPKPYYLPTAGSPLIDAGQTLEFDHKGLAPDIGAYEFQR